MKSATSNNAQVSLELMLLMSVFFSVLLLFAPLISKTFFLGIYALDSARAKNFSDSFTVAVTELNSMSNESKIQLTAKPLLEWKIRMKDQILNIDVVLSKYKKINSFSSQQFNIIPFQELSLNAETVFILSKTEKGILIEIQKL